MRRALEGFLGRIFWFALGVAIGYSGVKLVAFYLGGALWPSR